MKISLIGLTMLVSYESIGQQIDSGATSRVNSILEQALKICKYEKECDRASRLADSGIELSSRLGNNRLTMLAYGLYIKGRICQEKSDFSGQYSILDSAIRLCRLAHIDTGHVFARTLLHFSIACENTGHEGLIVDALSESMNVFQRIHHSDFLVSSSLLLAYFSGRGQIEEGDQLILRSEQDINKSWPIDRINYFYFSAYQYYWKYKIINKAKYYLSRVDESAIEQCWELCNLFRSKLLFALENSANAGQKEYSDLLYQCMDCFHNDPDIQGANLADYHFNCAEVIIRNGLADMALADSLLLKADSIMGHFTNDLIDLKRESPEMDQLLTLWILQGMAACKKSDTSALGKIVSLLGRVTNGFNDFKNYDTARIGQFLIIAGKYYSMTGNEGLASILEKYKRINAGSLYQALNFMTGAELNQFIQVKLNSSFDIFFELYTEGVLPDAYTDFLYDQALYSKGLLYRQSSGLNHFLNKAKDPEIVQLRNEMDMLEQKIKLDTGRVSEMLVKDRELLEKKALYKYHKLTSSDSFSVDRIREKLKDGEIAVEFVKYNELLEPVNSAHYAALVIDNGRSHARFIRLFSETEFQSSSNSVREISLNVGESSPKMRGLKKRLSGDENYKKFKLIWEPVLRHFPHVKTIYYASTGSLNHCNLSCLPASDTDLMVNRFDMVQLSSTYNLREDLAEHSTPKSALLVGGVDYGLTNQDNGNSGELSWNYLKGTLEEVNDISAMIKQTGIAPLLLKGLAADNEGVKKALGVPAEIIHFATHGYYSNKLNNDNITLYQESEPLKRSKLVLAGVNTISRSNNNGKDGCLSAYEISKMDLAETKLVVLSACETARGDLVNQYESSYSLMRGFKMAGAMYILSSLRPVSDQETIQFMHSFYKYWLFKGVSIQQAFILTQREMQRVKAENLNWSSFVLVN